MKKNLINNQNIGKISTFILTGILFISIFIGSVFGLKSAIVNKGEIDESYNQKVSIQANVKIKNSDKNINDASNSLFQTLKFLGLDNSEIKSFGNETLQVIIPISSFLDDGKPSTDYIYKIENNISYTTEIEALEIALFFNGVLDFRTTDGASIFITDEKGMTIFNEDGVKPPDPDNHSNRRKDSDAPIEMFGKASLKHTNGSSYIRLDYKDASTSTINQYKIAFDDWLTYVNGGETLDYAVWFEYDKLEEIAKKIDSSYDSQTGLYNSYVSDGLTENEVWLKPFFVSEGTTPPIGNQYENYISLKNEQGKNWINEKTGSYFVNKINNSGNYHYSNINVSLNLKTSKGVILIVIMAIFILLIVVLIFLFSWYFGLLGFVAGSIVMLISMINSLIYSSMGLMVTGIGLSSLIISLLFISLLAFIILIMYKKNNDKSTSQTEKFKLNFKETNGLLFIPLTIFTLGLFVSGALLSPLVSISIYLIVLFTLIGYLLMISILFPILLLIDLFIDFSIEEFNGKWSFTTGKNSSNSNERFNGPTNSNLIKNSSTTFSIIGLSSLLLSVLIGGIVFSFMGTPINVAGSNNSNYQYQIELINKPINSIINDLDDTKTIAFLEQSYKNDTEKISDIKNIFSDNGVRTKKVCVDRMDELTLNDSNDSGPKIKLEATYGYTVYSNKKMNLKQYDDINNSLKDVIVVVMDGPDVDLNRSGFKLKETSSLTNFNDTSIKSINYSQSKEIWKGIYAILSFVIFSFATYLLIFGWGIGASYIITSILESSLIIGPLFIFFIPYNAIIWFTIILLTCLSSIIKSFVSRSVKKSDLTNDDIWFKKSSKTIPFIITFSIFILFIQLLLSISYGFIFLLSSIIILIWGTLVLCFSQYFVFPFYSKKLNNYRKQLKLNKKNDDVFRSKNNDNISEEYIEGINM